MSKSPLNHGILRCSKLLEMCHFVISKTRPIFHLSNVHYQRLGQYSHCKFSILSFDFSLFKNLWQRRTACLIGINSRNKRCAHSICFSFSSLNSSEVMKLKEKSVGFNISASHLSGSFRRLLWSNNTLWILPGTRLNSTNTSYCRESNLIDSNKRMTASHSDSDSWESQGNNEIDHVHSDPASEAETLAHAEPSALGVKAKIISDLAGTTYNLAPFVERSVSLQNLVLIGVDLSKVEKVKGMADHLVMSDFDKDVLPYLQHLANVGVEPNKLGYIISSNPCFLKTSMSDLEAQVGYLLSKKFSLQDIASMISRAPVMLLMTSDMIDQKLGFLQNVFKLSGYDVRKIALTFPKLLPWRKEKISAIRFTLKELLGFSDYELRRMITSEPKLFTANRRSMMKAFDYVNNTMLIPHKQIVDWPSILHKRSHIIKSRHLFLLHKGRAQYDPYQENYVSLKAMIACKDETFCHDVAKAPVSEYYNFLKTL